MNFEDLKDQFRDQMRELGLKIQDSDLYIKVRERYENLPQNYQRLILIFSALFAIYIIYSIPSGYMEASTELEETFVENRELTRDLIRAGRLERSITVPPAAPSSSTLKSQVDGVLKKQRIVESQKPVVEEAESVADSTIAPKKIDQVGARAKAEKLNLEQVVFVGEELVKLTGVHLINLTVQADRKDPHYFNVDYGVTAFSVNVETVVKQAPKVSKKSKKKKKKFKKKSEK